jgi:hypothetical protein
MAERIDVADAVAVEGDTDEVAGPLEPLLDGSHVAGVDHVVQRRVRIVHRGRRRQRSSAPDRDALPNKTCRPRDTLRGQKVQRTAVVLVTPTTPPLRRLEQLRTHPVLRSTSSSSLPPARG